MCFVTLSFGRSYETTTQILFFVKSLRNSKKLDLSSIRTAVSAWIPKHNFLSKNDFQGGKRKKSFFLQQNLEECFQCDKSQYHFHCDPSLRDDNHSFMWQALENRFHCDWHHFKNHFLLTSHDFGSTKVRENLYIVHPQVKIDYW